MLSELEVVLTVTDERWLWVHVDDLVSSAHELVASTLGSLVLVSSVSITFLGVLCRFEKRSSCLDTIIDWLIINSLRDLTIFDISFGLLLTLLDRCLVKLVDNLFHFQVVCNRLLVLNILNRF